MDAEKEFDFDGLGILTSLVVFDAPISVSSDGELDLTYLELQPQEPITLTGISFYGDDSASIVSSSVVRTQADGSQTDVKWDGKTPVPLLAGESARINVICVDPELAGIMEAITSKYILLHYKDAQGKEYTECMQGIYRMRQDLYDLYAAADGADVLSFYMDYYSDDLAFQLSQMR